MIDANIERNEKVSHKICLEPKVIKSSTLISDYLLFATFAIISLTIKFLPWMSNMSKMNLKKKENRSTCILLDVTSFRPSLSPLPNCTGLFYKITDKETLL